MPKIEMAKEERKALQKRRRDEKLVLALKAIEQETGVSAEREFVFNPTRRFRFDAAWPDALVAAEIDGAVWTGGRHTSPAGFLRDQEKTNLAGLDGWRVFRFTWKDVDSGLFLDVLVKALTGSGKSQASPIRQGRLIPA